MNLPNIITVSRVVMSFMTAALLCVERRWVQTFTLALFVAAGLTDWLDGWLARRENTVTTFGKFMDALADKIMVIGLFFVLIGLGMYKDWTIFAVFCALLSSSREFFVSGIRMLAANRQIVLPAEKIGKYKAAIQMYSIGAVIFARTLVIDYGMGDGFLYNLSFYSGLVALGISTLLSLISGASYGKRYAYLLKD